MSFWEICLEFFLSPTAYYYDEWMVEYEGVEIGRLKYPAYEDMFWVSYAVIPKKGMEFFFRDIKNWVYIPI